MYIKIMEDLGDHVFLLWRFSLSSGVQSEWMQITTPFGTELTLS